MSTSMAKVTVKFHGLIMDKDVERAEEYEVTPGTTVRAVMELFVRRHLACLREEPLSGDSGKLWETHVVMLNGIGLVPEKQLTTEVKEGDSISVFLPVSGG